MDISNKDIWRDDKKYCIICEKENKESGIQIMNNFICEECVQRMNIIDVSSDEYENVKNKLMNAIASRISNLKDSD